MMEFYLEFHYFLYFYITKDIFLFMPNILSNNKLYINNSQVSNITSAISLNYGQELRLIFDANRPNVYYNEYNLEVIAFLIKSDIANSSGFNDVIYNDAEYQVPDIEDRLYNDYNEYTNGIYSLYPYTASDIGNTWTRPVGSGNMDHNFGQYVAGWVSEPDVTATYRLYVIADAYAQDVYGTELRPLRDIWNSGLITFNTFDRNGTFDASLESTRLSGGQTTKFLSLIVNNSDVHGNGLTVDGFKVEISDSYLTTTTNLNNYYTATQVKDIIFRNVWENTSSSHETKIKLYQFTYSGGSYYQISDPNYGYYKEFTVTLDASPREVLVMTAVDDSDLKFNNIRLPDYKTGNKNLMMGQYTVKASFFRDDDLNWHQVYPYIDTLYLSNLQSNHYTIENYQNIYVYFKFIPVSSYPQGYYGSQYFSGLTLYDKYYLCIKASEAVSEYIIENNVVYLYIEFTNYKDEAYIYNMYERRNEGTVEGVRINLYDYLNNYSTFSETYVVIDPQFVDIKVDGDYVTINSELVFVSQGNVTDNLDYIQGDVYLADVLGGAQFGESGSQTVDNYEWLLFGEDYIFHFLQEDDGVGSGDIVMEKRGRNLYTFDVLTNGISYNYSNKVYCQPNSFRLTYYTSMRIGDSYFSNGNTMSFPSENNGQFNYGYLQGTKLYLSDENLPKIPSSIPYTYNINSSTTFLYTNTISGNYAFKVDFLYGNIEANLNTNHEYSQRNPFDLNIINYKNGQAEGPDFLQRKYVYSENVNILPYVQDSGYSWGLSTSDGNTSYTTTLYSLSNGNINSTRRGVITSTFAVLKSINGTTYSGAGINADFLRESGAGWADNEAQLGSNPHYATSTVKYSQESQTTGGNTPPSSEQATFTSGIVSYPNYHNTENTLTQYNTNITFNKLTSNMRIYVPYSVASNRPHITIKIHRGTFSSNRYVTSEDKTNASYILYKDLPKPTSASSKLVIEIYIAGWHYSTSNMASATPFVAYVRTMTLSAVLSQKSVIWDYNNS